MRIAFLGLGLMGAPMARHCLAAGYELTVYNRTAAKCEPLRQAGAAVAASPAEAARDRELILICVEDTPDVEQVLFGEQGVIHGLEAPPAGQAPPIVIDHSTISPEATAGFAERLALERCVAHLDAPVSGGTTGAQAGTLSIMVGGPAEAFARARPVFEAMGRTIVHIGERHGDGQRAKLINQVVVAINCLATTEAMRLGEALGVEMPRVLEAISQGAAGSWSLSNLGPRWLARDFAPGFRLRHLMKDLQFGEQAIARLVPAPLHDPSADSGDGSGAPADGWPALSLALDLVRRAVAAGHGDENIHAVARVFESGDS